jgi:hypothetical protein
MNTNEHIGFSLLTNDVEYELYSVDQKERMSYILLTKEIELRYILLNKEIKFELYSADQRDRV